MRLTTCPLAAPHRETAGEGYAGPIEWSTARFLPAPPHLGELQHHRDQCELAAIYSSSCLHQLGNITPGQRQSELEIPRQRLTLPASGVRSADEFHHHRFQPEEQVPALPVHIPPPHSQCLHLTCWAMKGLLSVRWVLQSPNCSPPCSLQKLVCPDKDWVTKPCHE